LPPYLDVIASGSLPLGFAGVVNVRNGTSASVTVTLPASPTAGQVLTVKDALGNAGTYPIIIVSAAGTIDGNANYGLYSNYMSAELYWMGTQWGSR
jgi:hypothetical protein